jgi:branched-chain amino acid transport system permease protein
VNVYFVPGLVIGCVWAIAATGTVLTYSTSGVLNLAFGGEGYAAAVLFHSLRTDHGLNGWVAVIICGLGFGPVFGAILWQLIFRQLVSAGPTASLVASIGLAVALPAVATMIFQPGQVFVAPGIADNGTQVERLGDIALTVNEIYVIVATLIVTACVLWTLRHTMLGLKQRAVFDNRAVAALAGANTSMVSLVSWCIGSTLASVGGILLAPILQLNADVFTELTVASLAAALIARLGSVEIAVLAAIGLGILSSVFSAIGPTDGLLAVGVQPSIPFVAIFITLLVRRTPIADGSGLAIARMFSAVRRRTSAPWSRRAAPCVLVVLVVVPGFAVTNAYWLGVATLAAIYATIFLGYSVGLGDGGLIPLGQSAIVGIGGFAAGWSALHAKVPLLLAVVVGAAVAAAFGVVLAFLGARLGTIEFGLLALAFGLFCDYFLFNWHAFVPIQGTQFGMPSLFGYLLDSPVRQYYLCGAVLVLAIGIVGFSRTRIVMLEVHAGRTSVGLAEASGVNVRGTRVLAFTISAGLAGVGGGLLGTFQQQIGPANVSTVVGLVWLAVAVMIGIRSVGGAVAAALMMAFVPAICATWLPLRIGELPTALFGLGGLALATNPAGSAQILRDYASAAWHAVAGARPRSGGAVT